MKLQRARKKLHDMRTSLNVVSNFILHLEPTEDVEREYKDVVLRSVKKLNDAVEELSELVHNDIDKKRLNGCETIG